MAKLKVKKGDSVVVISGKNRGKTGKITQIIPAQNKAVVEGVNIIIKHQKPKGNKEKGGIVKKSAPMQISNLMVVCSVCGKATRVAKKEISGKLSRICKKCGAGLDKEYVKAVKKDQKKKDAVKGSEAQKNKPKKEEVLTEKIVAQETEIPAEKASKETLKAKAVKTVKNAESKTAGKTAKPKVRNAENEQVKKVTNVKAGRTTTIRKSTNRGK